MTCIAKSVERNKGTLLSILVRSHWSDRIETALSRHLDSIVHFIVLGVLMLLLLVGCKVGPNYKRPVVDTPQTFRGAMAPDINPENSTQSLGDEQWSDVFKDPVVKQLIGQALANNFDARIAAQRVAEAEAQAGIVRSQQFPSISVGGNESVLRLPTALVQNYNNRSGNSGGNSLFYGGGFFASSAWNLDFWGLYRRQTEAARAQLLATEWGERATRMAVVESVAQAYLQLRTLDRQLEITKRTIAARQDSLHLTRVLEEHGAGSLADVRQAEELLYAANVNLPLLTQAIEQQENNLSVLLGHNPGPVARGLEITDQPHPAEIPAGIPSRILERRPDILQAEANLIAANAEIGVAKAQFFPQMSLTTLAGTSTSQLNTLFNQKNAYWYATGSFSQSVFDAGRLRNNYRLSKSVEQETLVNYQKTIAGAFRDVANALIAYRKTRERREQQEQETEATAGAVSLARVRYNGGNTSYLEVLTNDTNLYNAQLTLADTEQQEALSLVQLYAALGGGWQ
jgi:multidrug efflux system outer membrane protein